MMSISIVAKQLLKAVVAVRLAIPGICLVLSALKLLAAVGAGEALRVELVAHGRDDPALDHVRAHKALVFNWWIICNNLYQNYFCLQNQFSPTRFIFSSIALLNISDISSFSNISKGSPAPEPDVPGDTSTFLKYRYRWDDQPLTKASSSHLLLRLPPQSLISRSSNSLVEADSATDTVHTYMMG